ncbi:MAG: hypothetical protein RMK90_14130 [Acetobacteraceae bacterium]|nr:hypothetical protein [Acetobacteraceae bacterium]
MRAGRTHTAPPPPPRNPERFAVPDKGRKMRIATPRGGFRIARKPAEAEDGTLTLPTRVAEA